MSYCTYSGDFLVVQCLRFCTFDAGDMGSILGQGAKIPHAAERVKGMKRVTWKLNSGNLLYDSGNSNWSSVTA